MTELRDLQARYEEFVQARDWEQFHTPKNLAEAISIEASELLEVFLWHDNFSAAEIAADGDLTAQIEEELADVVIFCLGLATRLDIDLAAAVETKLDANKERFDKATSREITDELREWKRTDRD